MNGNKEKLGKKIRVTLDLTPQFYKRLEELEELVAAESKAGMIRQALQLYEYVARKSLDGWGFRAVDSKGREENIVFLSVQSGLSR